MKLLDVPGPAGVFGETNLLGADYRIALVSATGIEVTSSIGLRIAVGTSRVRMPAYITRPPVGAFVAALVVMSAARTKLGESTSSSPRMRRREAALPRSRAATEASAGIVSQALGMCRAASPSAKL